MKAKVWIIGWVTIVTVALALIAGFVYIMDPYFHYHKPNTDKYYYDISNQRSQNDGICKHFDYDAIITGTSMTENFRTSEMDELFGVTSIKVPYSGGTYKEVNDNLMKALSANDNIRIVVRGLDQGKFFDDPDEMRMDLGTYPTYLYDDNLFNDVNYLFNKDVIFNRAYAMAVNRHHVAPGMTSFDDYSRWHEAFSFGIDSVAPEGISYNGPGEAVHLSETDREMIYEQITQNVTSLADKYPDVDFYYFFTPYSVIWYEKLAEEGTIYRQIEAEQYIIELILEHENIKLFSFNSNENLLIDINNFKDPQHYATWVNSYMLSCMQKNEYRLTRDNYFPYLERELEFFVNFDYNSINNQEDYHDDFYAAALFNEDIWNVKPIDVLNECKDSIELSSAEIVYNQYDSKEGIRCRGCLQWDEDSEVPLDEYIVHNECIGAKVSIGPLEKHNYLVFYGKKLTEYAQPNVVILDENNNIVGNISVEYSDIDMDWNRFFIDLSNVDGNITVYFNGGAIDTNGGIESEYIFSNIVLY